MVWQFGLFGPGGTDPTTIDAATFGRLVLQLLQYALGLIGAIALVYIVIAAIQYMTAGGNAGKQEEAKKAIQAAIIGIVIIILSFTLVNTVLQRLSFDDSIIENSDQLSPIRSTIPQGTNP